jgi:hypothetical protein
MYFSGRFIEFHHVVTNEICRQLATMDSLQVSWQKKRVSSKKKYRTLFHKILEYLKAVTMKECLVTNYRRFG